MSDHQLEIGETPPLFVVPEGVAAPPRLGEEGYRDHLREQRRRGELTQAEFISRLAEHGEALREAPHDEAGVLEAAAEVGRPSGKCPDRTDSDDGEVQR